MQYQAAFEPEYQTDPQLTTIQASNLTGLSIAWFERARWAGNGPPFRRLGRSVRYPLSELKAWIDAHPLLRSTTTTGQEG